MTAAAKIARLWSKFRRLSGRDKDLVLRVAEAAAAGEQDYAVVKNGYYGAEQQPGNPAGRPEKIRAGTVYKQ